MCNKKKILNNKVEFNACGKSITMRLSDGELKLLRRYSIYEKGRDLEKMNSGNIYNFSLYALFDYEIKSRSKAGRIYANFRYKDFDMAFWHLVS